MAMDELEAQLARLAERSEALASKVERLARHNKALRREVADILHEVDAMLTGAEHA